MRFLPSHTVIGCIASLLLLPILSFAQTLQQQLGDSINLAHSQGVKYNQVWTPPDELASVRMDCSNTAQWLIRRCENINLPRTASAQYEFLKQQHRLFRAPHDLNKLRSDLQPGDLLFWENTYPPKRRPPVTHVMVYLGTNAQRQMLMAGAQASHGLGIYAFHPDQHMGGYRFFFGLFRRHGKFVAYGRPRGMN